MNEESSIAGERKKKMEQGDFLLLDCFTLHQRGKKIRSKRRFPKGRTEFLGILWEIENTSGFF